MDNTVSILTPPGLAAIAVVRLHGPLVTSFCQRHLKKMPRVGACVHTELFEQNPTDPIDDPVAVLVDAQTLDLSLHGGAWVIQRCTDLAVAFGFAIINQQDLQAFSIEDEVARDLPHARTRQAIAILLSQPVAWQQMLNDTDADRRGVAMHQALNDRSLQHLLNPPTVAIVGRPNVGKSTLANQLFAREHSITADLPGTTRDWVGEQANLDGLVITLIDTPGQRETDDPIERQAIVGSAKVIEQASLIVEVIDATDPQVMPPAKDATRSAPRIAVVNKTDRVSEAIISSTDAIRIVATTGHGVDALRHAIRSHFHCANLSSPHARCWTDRQRAMLAAEISPRRREEPDGTRRMDF